MGKRSASGTFIPDLEILSAGSEGKGVGRYNEKVVFVKYAAPGDIADVKVLKSKQSFAEAEIVTLKKYSANRVAPFCGHFGTCGGCQWQHVNYQAQLEFKQQQVHNALTRIGKLDIPEMLPILGVENDRAYRNKLDFSFTHQRWLFPHEMGENSPEILEGVGFHIPGKFDKVLHVENCGLMNSLADDIRNEVYRYALRNKLSFFNLRSQQGFLRALIIRNTRAGEWMVIAVFRENLQNEITALLNHLAKTFPQISSLHFVVNEKRNDSLYDQEIHLYQGTPHITETIGGLKFKIRPKSFFQTNPTQAERLFQVVKDFADLKGTETVYDLYTGTGTIALSLAPLAKEVIGIESVADAIADARENAEENGLSNLSFYVGDMRLVLNDNLIALHGRPDLIVCDPPRSGMHPDVVQTIKASGAPRVVYVSCSPATQARDMAMMSDVYLVQKTRPVDMFPHTAHVENVALLIRK